MAWVKLDDQIADHPKIIQAGPLAGWLYICGLAYCSRLLTDGFIPAAQVRRLADVKGPDALAKRLVAVGLWEACDDGYRVHDYFDYQPTRERVMATRVVRAEAGSAGGKRRASNAEANGNQTASNLLENGLPIASSTIQPRPVPSQPTPVQETSPAGESARTRATPSLPGPNVRTFVPHAGMTQMPEDWEPSDEDRAFARQNGMSGREIAHNAVKCRAHYRSRGEWRENWSEAWRLWVLREIEGGPGAPRLPPLPLADLPPTEEDRAADAANRADLERQRKAYAASLPSPEERMLQKARDDPDRPDYVEPETWMRWDTKTKRANSPEMRKRLST